MVDGVIYASGPYSYVFALDARTGRVGVLDGRLVALDRHTGLVKWAV